MGTFFTLVMFLTFFTTPALGLLAVVLRKPKIKRAAYQSLGVFAVSVFGFMGTMGTPEPKAAAGPSEEQRRSSAEAKLAQQAAAKNRALAAKAAKPDPKVAAYNAKIAAAGANAKKRQLALYDNLQPDEAVTQDGFIAAPTEEGLKQGVRAVMKGDMQDLAGLMTSGAVVKLYPNQVVVITDRGFSTSEFRYKGKSDRLFTAAEALKRKP
jgi:hypothetical protein